MHAYSTWNIDASQILQREELAAVLHDLKKRTGRLPNLQMNLAILRLACCCGLRESEVGGLRLGDVRVDIGPHTCWFAPSTPNSIARAAFRCGGMRERWPI